MSEAARTWRAQALLPRVATIAIGAPLLIAVIVIGGNLLMAAVLLLTLAGALEYRHLAFAAGHQPMVRAGALFYPLLAGLGRWDAAGGVTVGIVIMSAFFSLASWRRAGAPAAAAVDTLGAIYIGGLFAHLILFRSEAGVAPILTVLGAIWLGDIAAYLVGVRWGRRRLAPDISPGKSVEGLIAGLVVATVAALASAVWNGWPPLSVALIGLCAAAAGVVGDLFESTMKRAAGVKDSAGLLPGHGGILDRFDAVLFGVPVGYYMWGWLM